MSSKRKLKLIIPDRKNEFDPTPKREIPSDGLASPDTHLIGLSPPVLSDNYDNDRSSFSKIGPYLLRKLLDEHEDYQSFQAVNPETLERFTCKVTSKKKSQKIINVYQFLQSHPNIAGISNIIFGEQKVYIFFPETYGDLHSFIRLNKKLTEQQAKPLFTQILSAVEYCHCRGILLGDLNLRRFRFKDCSQTELVLDGLEDCHSGDLLTNRQGCPAYVSPEKLLSKEAYSGFCSELWSLGVMLYTTLVGRYPFHDALPTALFSKICKATFKLPEMMSPLAKSLIQSFLRREPKERITAHDALEHAWLSQVSAVESCDDHEVPSCNILIKDDPPFIGI